MHDRQAAKRRAEHPDQACLPYVKPEIRRVDLALEETLSAGCKLAEVCDDPFNPEGGQPGS